MAERTAWDGATAQQLDQWIVVVDGDALSQSQMAACRALHVPLRGAVECHKPDNADAEVCQAVPYFPAFCHTELNQCVYGVRREVAEFEALASVAPPPRTTPPAPPPSAPAPP